MEVKNKCEFSDTTGIAVGQNLFQNPDFSISVSDSPRVIKFFKALGQQHLDTIEKPEVTLPSETSPNNLLFSTPSGITKKANCRSKSQQTIFCS